MIYSRNDLNSLPEQVQENLENIKALKELYDNVEAGIVKGKKIWENDDPSISFPATVVSLDGFEDYTRFEIVFADSTSGSRTISIIMSKDYVTQAQFLNTSYFYERKVEYDAVNNEIDFADATKNDISNGTYTTDNTLLVPLAIIGFDAEIEA